MKFRKLVSVVLLIAMVLTSVNPSFALDNETIKSIVKEQSDEDYSTERTESTSVIEGSDENDDTTSEEETEPEESSEETETSESEKESSSGEESSETTLGEEPEETEITETTTVVVTTFETEKEEETTLIVDAETTTETNGSTIETTVETSETEETETSPIETTTVESSDVTNETTVTNQTTVTNETIVNEEIVATDSDAEEDYKEPFFGYIPSKLPPIIVSENNSKLFGDSADLPETYDARNITNDFGVSIIPPIRNQNPGGTCWAFATIGMMETSIRKKNLVAATSTVEQYNTNSDLSEAAFSYFVIEGLKNVTNSADIDKPGVEGRDYNAIDSEWYTSRGYDVPRFTNSGGNYIDATLVGSTYMGATKESKVPYSANHLNHYLQNGIPAKYAFNQNEYEMGNVYMIPKTDRDAIKRAVMENGSVGVSYHEAQKDYSIAHEGSEWYYMSPRKFDDNGNNKKKCPFPDQLCRFTFFHPVTCFPSSSSRESPSLSERIFSCLENISVSCSSVS